jgi:hypothetical protein
MAKEAVISNSRLNRYGSRILTEGIDTTQYERNPILLWMHNRAWRGTADEVLPIGRIENLRKDGDNIIGTPVFDEKDEFAKKIASKWHDGYLKMVSAGLDIIESSVDSKYLVEGQTRATITKSRLTEVSIVDIGANDDAVALYHEGKALKLAADIENSILPIINSNQNSKNMELKVIALKLGLPESAAEAEILAAADGLLAAKAERDTLRQQLETAQHAAIEGEVDAAIKLGKFPADKKAHFVDAGKKLGLDALRQTLECMAPSLRPTQVINPASGAALSMPADKKWKDMSDAERIALRLADYERYRELYVQEYGVSL